MNKSRKGTFILLVILCLLCAAGGIFTNVKKKNFQMDEYYSYGSSNSQSAFMHIEPGKTYEKGSTPYEDYLIVNPDEKFQYTTVWNNQKEDTHPPLYYLLLHTACSLIPGRFSIWCGAMINMIFLCAFIVVLYKLSAEVLDDTGNALCTCLVFLFSGLFIDAVSFYRMYAMLMFWSVLITYLHVMLLKNGTMGGKTIGALILVSCLGTLTHYFFLVVLFFECVYFAIWLLRKKKHGKLVLYVFAMLGSGLLVLLIWPTILKHMFKGGRGRQSFSNLVKSTGYFQDLWGRIQQLDEMVFGGTLLVWAVLLTAAFLYCGLKKKRVKELLTYPVLGIVGFTSLCYTLIVTKIAVSNGKPYFYVVYPLILIWVCGVLFSLAKRISGEKAALALILVLTVLGGIRGKFVHTPEFLYLDNTDIEIAKEYAENPCVYIYNNNYSYYVQTDWLALKNYESLTFVPDDNLQLLQTLVDANDSLIVYVQKECNIDQVVGSLLEKYPKLNKAVDFVDEVYCKGYHFWN